MPANAPNGVVRQHEISIASWLFHFTPATPIYNLLYFSPVFVMFYFLLMFRDNSLSVYCQCEKKKCLFGSEGDLHLQKVEDPCLVVVKTVGFFWLERQ